MTGVQTCALPIYEAWPRNAFALRRLQGMIVSEISKELPIKLGTLTTISGSAHIYEKNWPDSNEIIEKNRPSYTIRFDPKGNFRVETKDAKIKVTHKDIEGNPIGEYEGDTAMKVMIQLAHNRLFSEVGHALDIGAELQKAEIALKNNLKYTQDKPLELK